jgi:hypothetical protein
MPEVVINRPNRTKRRYFRACDAARIAREVVKDDQETTPEEVLACIAKGFGFTHVSLSRLRVVESGIQIRPKDVVVLTKTALTLLEKLAVKFPRLAKFLAPIIEAMKKAGDYLQKIDTIDPPQQEVDDVINKLKCQCKEFVVAKEGQSVE